MRPFKLTLAHLEDHADFQGLVAISTKKEMAEFLKKLRQDFYSPAQLEPYDLSGRLDTWVKSSSQNTCTFFAYEDEPDEYLARSGWGRWKLYRCAAVLTAGGKIHFFKKLIFEFLK